MSARDLIIIDGELAHFEIGVDQYITIGLWPSAGTDGAMVLQIDTNFEPDDMPLRINLNDAPIFGKEYSDE